MIEHNGDVDNAVDNVEKADAISTALRNQYNYQVNRWQIEKKLEKELELKELEAIKVKASEWPYREQMKKWYKEEKPSCSKEVCHCNNHGVCLDQGGERRGLRTPNEGDPITKEYPAFEYNTIKEKWQQVNNAYEKLEAKDKKWEWTDELHGKEQIREALEKWHELEKTSEIEVLRSRVKELEEGRRYEYTQAEPNQIVMNVEGIKREMMKAIGTKPSYEFIERGRPREPEPAEEFLSEDDVKIL